METRKRADIRIEGDVQMAGFRTFIKNSADSLNLKGFAENLEDGSVRVVCEGEEEAIKGLINLVMGNTPPFVCIEAIDTKYEEYKGEFISFDRRGADVPGEESEMVALMRSFDKKAEVMIGILSSMNGKQDQMLDKQDQMLDKQDQMLGKQDETIGAIREVSEKIDEAKEDIVTEIRQSKEEIVTEIGSLREDLKSYMENKFTRIEHEIEAIKGKIGMV